MKILAVEHELCKSRELFEIMMQQIAQSKDGLRRADQVERELFSQLLELGRSLLSAFLKGSGDGNVGSRVEHCGRVLKRSNSKKKRPYRSIFGVIQIERYVYARRDKQKAEYLPVDQALGLPQGEHSYVLEDWLQRFCVQKAFAASVESIADLLGCSVSTRTAERMNREMGSYVEPFRMQKRVTDSDEQILVVSADGKGVPMRRPLDQRVPKSAVPAWLRHYRKQQATRGCEQTGKRIGVGQNRMQKQMAYVGAVYSVRPFKRTADDLVDELRRNKKAASRPRPQNKRVWAEMTDHRQEDQPEAQPRLFAGLATEVYQRDPAQGRPLVCLMDGQRSLWKMKEQWLRHATGILDIFHAMERLWKAAYCFHREGSLDAEGFVTHQLRMLLTGKVGYVIGYFRRRMAGLTASKQKTLSRVIQYFDRNRQYMRYDDYLKKGYPIGSGVAEGTCRHLVRDRMEGTGMRWELDGAQAMLDTRSVYVNRDWDEFIEYRIQKEQDALYTQAA